MKTQLMYLTIPTDLDYLLVEPNFATEDHEFMFECDMSDNPMDADDPEFYLSQYYRSVGAR